MNFLVGFLQVNGIRTLLLKLATFYCFWLLVIGLLSASIQALSKDDTIAAQAVNRTEASVKAAKKPKQNQAAQSVLASRELARQNNVNGGVWDDLAMCESSGDWQINTGNGYYGGIQFKLSSWRAVGGTGLPHQATKSEQIARAEKLKAIQGWQAWPECSAKLGLI